jgi:release factor glutamine methyltransferase
MLEMLTIQQALRGAKTRFDSVSDSSGLDAQLLLESVLSVDRAYLLAHPEAELIPEQEEQFNAYVERRAAGEPIPYILGKRAFYDREIVVTPDVLIPRPETELLLEEALKFADARLTADTVGALNLTPLQNSRAHFTAVDIGTGSGALAVTFAANVPDAVVYAVDISPTALKVAQRNAELHQAQVTFFQGDLLQPLIERGIKVDLLMANLPYIASGELPDLEVSKHEPLLALDGGLEGLDLILRLLEQSPQVCNPGALILLEIGWDQGDKTLALARDLLSPVSAEVIKDYAKLDRIVRIFLKGGKAQQADKRSLRVFIISDPTNMFNSQEALKTFLAQSTEFEWAGAADTGQEGISQFQHLQPDVVLVDSNVSDMNTAEIIQAIRKLSSYVVIIALSVSNEPAWLQRCMKAGVDTFLTKPLIADEVYNTLRVTYDRKYQ